MLARAVSHQPVSSPVGASLWAALGALPPGRGLCLPILVPPTLATPQGLTQHRQQGPGGVWGRVGGVSVTCTQQGLSQRGAPRAGHPIAVCEKCLGSGHTWIPQ